MGSGLTGTVRTQPVEGGGTVTRSAVVTSSGEWAAQGGGRVARPTHRRPRGDVRSWGELVSAIVVQDGFFVGGVIQ